MIRSNLTRLALAATLIATIPTATAAQDAEATPEGVDWHLAGYAVEGEIGIVPWHVDPTLRLDDGTASGSSGCNRLSGTYVLEGAALAFDEAFALTRMACGDEANAIEDAYLAALPRTASWSVEDDVLSLFDDAGDRLLDFERSVVGLTPSDVSALQLVFADQQAQLDRLDERLDSIRIGTLRDRIKALEGEVETLRAAAASSGGGSAFSAAEKVLLKGIPRKVEKTCQPLRSGLPAGTVAAVACDGSRKAVAEQAYYLMEWVDAEATLKSVASSKGVPNKRPRCHNQKAGWISYGTAVGAEACWSEGGKANYRLITSAAGCKQLDVAGTHLAEPAIYLAMEGVGNKMEPVRAAGLAYTDADYLIMNFEAGEPIPAGDQPQTPGCKGRQPISF